EAHVPVYAALIQDPVINHGEIYDGNGLGVDPVVAALNAALEELGGTTLIIASADLSHVGPAFGDQQSLAGDSDEAKSSRERVATHDREMLSMFEGLKFDDLVASMAWQQNPTRWCSVGNMTAAAKVVDATDVKLLNYAGAMDEQGLSLVSHAAMAIR
ncbi:MAG: MEMO1 family protein, partial [Planctomycetota bacterium]